MRTLVDDDAEETGGWVQELTTDLGGTLVLYHFEVLGSQVGGGSITTGGND